MHVTVLEFDSHDRLTSSRAGVQKQRTQQCGCDLKVSVGRRKRRQSYSSALGYIALTVT